MNLFQMLIARKLSGGGGGSDPSQGATATAADIVLGKTAAANGEMLTGTNDFVKPTKGFFFGNFDSDGYPHSFEFTGSWTEIPAHFMQFQDAAIDGTPTGFVDDNFTKNINKVVVPHGVTKIKQQAFRAFLMKELDVPETCHSISDECFRNCVNLRTVTIRSVTVTRWFYPFFFDNLSTVIFTGNVPALSDLLTGTHNTLQLIDFSNNTQVCQLGGTNKMPHASGCVIRVPQSLLAEWQEETNWIDLPTDPNVSGYVVWQGV